MAEGGTIIIGKLDDNALKKSIDELVKNIKDKTNEMATSFDSAINRMSESLGKLSKMSIQTSQREQSIKKEQESIKETALTYDDLAKAVKKVVDTNSGIKSSFSQQELQSYISLLRNVQNQYEQMNLKGSATTITNEAMRGWMRSLEQVIAKYQDILKNIDYVNNRQGTIDTKQWIQSFSAVDERLKQLNNWYKELEKADQKRIADAAKADQKRLAEMEAANKKALAQIEAERKAREKMAESARKAELRYQDTVLKTQFQRTLKMPTENVDQMRTKLERLKVLLASMQEIGLLSPAQIVSAEQAIQKLNSEIAKTAPAIRQSSQAVQQQAQDYSFLLQKSAQVEMQEQKSAEEIAKRGAQAQEILQRYRNELQKIAEQKGGVLDPKDIQSIIPNYQRLLMLFRQLNQAYYSLSESGRQSPMGKSLKEDLELVRKLIPQMRSMEFGLKTTKEQIQILETELGKLNREYLALSKSDTVSPDQLQKIESLREKINFLTNAIKELKKEEENSAAVSKKVAQANLEVEQANTKLITSNDKLARTFDYIQKRVMFLVTTYGSMRFLKEITSIRGEFETMERSLGVLLDSAQRGTQMFNELNQMALNSPFTTMELTSAARQLLAYGVAEEELVDTTRRLADVSAAVGTPIERISYALGQVQTYGYLTSLQAKSFMRSGIPLVKELAQMYTELEGKMVSTGDVYDRMKHKAVSYDDVLKVIKRDTDEGGRFFDYQAKMADTLKVQLANLSLAYQNMINDIGKSGQGIISGFISVTRAAMLQWKEVSKLITAVAIAWGLYKLNMMRAAVIQRGKMILDTRELLNSKQATYQTNERRLALGKLTIAEKEHVLAQRANLISIYKTQIANGELTASEVRKRLQIDKSNIALATAAFDAGLLTKAEYKLIISTNATAGAFARMGTFLKAHWGFFLLTAIVEVTMRLINMGQVAEDVTNSVINHTKENAKSLKEFLDQNKEIRNSLYEDYPARDAWNDGTIKSPDVLAKRDLPQDEATKVWENIRDEIQRSSSASDIFIAKLLTIEDTNERVRQGFNYVEQIQKTHEALQMLNHDNIEINEDWSKWYTLWAGQDGLVDNLHDYTDGLREVIQLEQRISEEGEKMRPESLRNLKDLLGQSMRDASDDLNTFANDLRDTIQSLQKENIRLKIIDPEAQRESLEVFLADLVEQTGMSAEDAMVLRMNAEKMYAETTLAQYDERLAYARKTNDLEAVDRITKQKQAWMESYGYGRASFQVFFKELKRTHSDLFDGMSMEEIQHLDKNSKQYRTMIDFLENEFKNSQITAHRVAYEDLKGKVDDILTWVLHIPVFFDIRTNAEDLKSTIRSVVGDAAGEIEVGDVKNTYEYVQKINKEWDEVNAQIDYYKSRNNLSESEKKTLDYLVKRRKELELQRSKLNAPSSKQENKDQKEAAKIAAKAERERIKEENRRKREAAKEEARRKREEAARRREQKQQEDELAKALKDEVSLVDKLRSSYDKLRKSGVAPDMIASVLYTNYEDTFKDINKSLKKYGLEEISVFDLIDPITKEFKNDQNVFEFFTQQLEKVKNSGRSTREAIKALEEELAKMREELQIKGMEGIFKTLKENLDFASNEYELSLDVEENPELADLMSSMMNVDITDMLKDAPKSLREYTDKVNDIIDGAIRAYWVNMNPEKGLDEYFTEFNARNFNILDKDTFDKIRQELTPDSQLFKEIEKLREDLLKKNRKFFDDVEKTYEQYLQKHGDYADKIRKIEEKKYEDLKQLDDVYKDDSLKSTYDYQRRREAIIQSAKESKQKVDFDEFKESETYLELFENLDYASETTLTMMINKIREMRQELTDLDPSELKKLAEYEQKLRDQMVKRNPFKNFKKEFKEYVNLQKQRKQIEKNAVKAEDEVKTQQKIVSVLSDQLEQMKTNGEYGTDAYKKKEEELKSENKKLGVLKKQNKAAQQQVTTLNQSETAMRQRASSMADFLGYALDAANALNQIAQESNNIDLQNATEATSDILGNLQAAAQGFAQGGVWGAVAAGVMDLAPKLVKWFNKESGIDKAIQRSEREVKKLQNTLKNLEDTAEDAYGAVTIGAQNAIRANKELQLVELERQLRLEQSRKKKKRDQDKIIDLKGQIIDLRNEINNSSEDVVNDLLGISGAGSWAEELVSSMIEAFRNGEDAMEKFSEKWDEMIDNMIMKYIVSTVMQRWWDNVLKGVEDVEESYTKDIAKEKADAQREYDEIRDRSDREIKDQMIKDGYWNALLEKYKNTKVMATNARYDLIPKEDVEAFRNGLLNSALTKVEEVDGRLDQASIDATKAITDYMLGRKGEGEAIAQQLKDTIGQYYQFGESANKDLSQLQQGIQGITEDTAGALEAYMNGVSQQVYLQSDLMTQIRDVVVGYDPVLSMGLQSQMLLELQNSYQIQVAIQNILVGWSNPSGNAVQVSLI